MISFVFKQFECCGIDAPRDWNIALRNDGDLPTSCCKRAFGAVGSDICNINMTDTSLLHHDGCIKKFGDYVRDHAFSLGIAGVILAILQVSILVLNKIIQNSRLFHNFTYIYFLVHRNFLCLFHLKNYQRKSVDE